MDGREVELPHNRGDRGSRKGRLAALMVGSSLASTALSLLLAFTTALGQQTDYLNNGGFEEGTSGWTVSLDATFVTVTTPVRSGSWAASLGDCGSAGEINIRQDVPIFPGATYTLTGWVYSDEPDFRYVCLRLDWLPGGSETSQECLTDDNDFYRPLTVGPVMAPSSATKARISALAEVRDENPSSPAYFDDLTLTCSLTPRLHVPLLFKNYPR
jgi:hypothetical protein